jgi:RsiW-degrading membrane proteinase PrsW (M82 family)
MMLASSMTACAGQTAGLVNHSIPDTIFASGSLEMKIHSPTEFYFASPGATENLTVTVTNPANATMHVYTAIHRHKGWDIVTSLGEVSPHGEKTFNHPMNFSYNGRTASLDELGLLGKADNLYAGNTFYIKEDWSSYESRLKSILSYFGMIAAVLMLLIIAAMMFGVVTIEKHVSPMEKRASSRALSSILHGLHSAAGKITYAITSPRFWLFELACGGLIVLMTLLITLQNISADIGIFMFFIGGTAAVFMPVVFLVAAWLIYLAWREPFRYVAAMFMWGIMVTLVAFLGNTAVTMLLGTLVGGSMALAITAITIGPAIEEISKGTGLLVMSGRRQFSGPLEGLIFGFSIGMGFAAIENWLYFVVNANLVTVGGLADWALEIAYRSVVDSLGHGCLTGTTGLVMGYAISRRHTWNTARLGFLLGLPVAILLHGTMNFFDALSSVVPTAFSVPIPVFDPILVFGLLTLYILIGAYLRSRKIREGT